MQLPWGGAPPTHSARPPAPRGDTHVQTGMVGQHAVVAQGDVLLLPLLVQRLAAALQQHALRGERGRTQVTRHKP